MRGPGYLLAISILTVIVQSSWAETSHDEGTDCGRVVSIGTNVTSSGNHTGNIRITWHATIYEYDIRRCGGAVITTYHVISAASCLSFISRYTVTHFTVVGGKRYKDLNDYRDFNAQKRQVADVRVPAGYNYTNHELDIAVLILTTPFVFNYYVRPICLNFDMNLDRKQLTPGNVGVVTAWASSDGPSYLIEVTYMDNDTCVTRSDSQSKKYIHSDTICGDMPLDLDMLSWDDITGYGQSLSFPETVGGVQRYYLRGLKKGQSWSSRKGPNYFTHLLAHAKFINDSLAVSPRSRNTYVPVGSNFINIGAFICQTLKVPQCKGWDDTRIY